MWWYNHPRYGEYIDRYTAKNRICWWVMSFYYYTNRNSINNRLTCPYSKLVVWYHHSASMNFDPPLKVLMEVGVCKGTWTPLSVSWEISCEGTTSIMCGDAVIGAGEVEIVTGLEVTDEITHEGWYECEVEDGKELVIKLDWIPQMGYLGEGAWTSVKVLTGTSNGIVRDLSEEKLFIRESSGAEQAVDDSPVFREWSYGLGCIRVVDTVVIGGVGSFSGSHSHSSLVPAWTQPRPRG